MRDEKKLLSFWSLNGRFDDFFFTITLLNVSFYQFLDDDKEEEDEESSHAPSVASNKMEEGDSEDVSLGNF